MEETAQHAGNQPCWSRRVDKTWGYELWLVNTDKYCAKFLHLAPGYQCSLHRHPVKDETFLVLKGCCVVEAGAEMRELITGDRQHIAPGTWHRFSNHAETECHIFEISTHHSDEDVERREDSRAINGH